MKNQNKQTMLGGAIILVASTLLVKAIGALFKIPMTDMLGTVGRGYFNSAYEVYTPIFSIAMSGLSVSVLRMVAEAVAKEKYKEARLTYKVSKRVFFTVGVIGTLIMFIIAYPYARYIADLRNIPAILCIAPSIFFCYYMSSYRGYYEGLRNMVPTGFSQVIEALGKLCFGLIFIKIFKDIGLSQFNSGMAATDNVSAVVFGKTVTNAIEANSAIAPWSAAGAVLGVTVGSVLSTISLSIYYRVKGDGFNEADYIDSPEPPERKIIAKNMIRIAIPMIISALVLNLTNLIDTATIQARLKTAIETDTGFDYVCRMFSNSFNLAIEKGRLNLSDKAEVVKYLWGAYGTALDFKNLVPMITVQLGLSSLPALATAWTLKNKTEIKSTIETVLRITMMIALPAGFGIAVLAKQILDIMYGRGASSDSIAIVAPIMAGYGCATFIMGVSTPITNMLQAIGRTDIPVKTVLAGAVVKIVCNFIFVGNYRFNIYGALIGTILFYVVIVGINLTSLLRLTGVKPRVVSVFLKPFICAVACGAAAYGANFIFNKIIPAGNTASVLNGHTISTILAVGAAMVVYLVLLLVVKCFNRGDVATLPKGEKLVKILDKFGFLEG